MPGPHSQTKPPSVLTQRPSQAALRHSSMSGGERGHLGAGGCRRPPAAPRLPPPSHQCSGCRWPSPPWRSRGDRRGPPPGTHRGYRRGRSHTPRMSPVALKGKQGHRGAPGPPLEPSHAPPHSLLPHLQGLCPALGGDRGPTWAGDALLSIRARAEVGGNAEAAATAEGAERCRARGQAAVRGTGTPASHPGERSGAWGACTHAGCTARCPEPASSRGNIRCRSLRSRRGAPRGA